MRENELQLPCVYIHLGNIRFQFQRNAALTTLEHNCYWQELITSFLCVIHQYILVQIHFSIVKNCSCFGASYAEEAEYLGSGVCWTGCQLCETGCQLLHLNHDAIKCHFYFYYTFSTTWSSC